MEITFETGKKLFVQGAFQEAETIFSLLLNGDLGDCGKSDILNALGACCYKQDKFEKALEYFNQAIALEPNNEKAIENRYKLFLKSPELSMSTVATTKPIEQRFFVLNNICLFCGKTSSQDSWILYICKYCGGVYCPNHRLPPNHNCCGLSYWKSNPPQGLVCSISEAAILSQLVDLARIRE